MQQDSPDIFGLSVTPATVTIAKRLKNLVYTLIILGTFNCVLSLGNLAIGLMHRKSLEPYKKYYFYYWTLKLNPILTPLYFAFMISQFVIAIKATRQVNNGIIYQDSELFNKGIVSSLRVNQVTLCAAIVSSAIAMLNLLSTIDIYSKVSQ